MQQQRPPFWRRFHLLNWFLVSAGVVMFALTVVMSIADGRIWWLGVILGLILLVLGPHAPRPRPRVSPDPSWTAVSKRNIVTMFMDKESAEWEELRARRLERPKHRERRPRKRDDR